MKFSAPTPPPAPAPIDPGQSALDYINAMADPALQGRLLSVEQEFRPQYAQLNLADLQTYLQGRDGQAGALDLFGQATQRAGEIQAAANTQQRQADITDVSRLGAQAAAAFRQANPELAAQLEAAKSLQTQQGGAAPDYGAYVRANPDLLANWQNNTSKNTNLSIEEYGKQHYEQSGKSEGRAVPTSQYSASKLPHSELARAILSGQPQFGQLSASPVSAAMAGSQGYNAALQGGPQQISAQNVGPGTLGDSLYGQALGASGLGAVGQRLQGRASDFAASTGRLTPDEIRSLQQSVREAYSAQGRGLDSAAVSAEALSRLTNQRGRMFEDIGLANALNASNQAELAANRGFQQSVQGADLARQFSNVGNNLQAQALNQSAGMQVAGANQAALNQAGAFGAGAANQAALANAAAQNQMGVFNAGQNLAVQDANRAFSADQYQRNIQNLGMLGQFNAAQLGADRNYAMQLAQAQAAIASDPFQAILGRQSGALQYGAGQQGFAGSLTKQMQGPQLFNPDAGINLGLQNSQNQANYNAAIYGAQAGARGQMLGGLFQGLGSLAGGILGGRG